MTIRNCSQTLVLVLLFGPIPALCDLKGPEVVGPPISTVTCRFQGYFGEGRDANSKFAVRGTPQNPQFIVKFDSYSGRARLERHEQPWPETFEMKISGARDTIHFVSLIPAGFGEIHLYFVPNKKLVKYYDDRGNRLDQPTVKAFHIETKETADGFDVKVTLPKPARSVRSLDVKYWSTCW